MGPLPPGFRLLWDASPFDVAWVLLPGLLLAALSALSLLLRRGAGRGDRGSQLGFGLLATLLFLGAVWWTLGGLGAWCAGVQALTTGGATTFLEGTLATTRRGAGGETVGFELEGHRFERARDALLPPLHAARWPGVALVAGQRVRVWFLGEDVLRLEVADAP